MMDEEQKQDIHWAGVRAAVRRLKNDPDFQIFLRELEYRSDWSRARSYLPEVKADHCQLLEEIVIQETIDNILVICNQPGSGTIEPDNDIEEALSEPE